MSEERAITLLIAEDSEVMLAALGHLLSRFKDLKTIGMVKDGTSAVELAEKLHPNVVLMDIGLPGMNGIEATRKIKQMLPETRVVMLTVHEGDIDVFAALAAGAHGYCLKTVSADQLSIAIRTVHEGAAWLDPKIARKVLQACTANVPKSEPASPGPLVSLTPREMDVLRHVVDGLTNVEIAERLYLSVETVKSHLRNVMDKLAVSDRTQAAVRAVRDKLI